MDFKPFPKIDNLKKAHMHITQKIHDTNAQVFIYKNEAGELELKCGSRTRWITPDSDNYGFATFVYANKAEFIEKLGVGQHFGEWAGKGINSGEGLDSKIFVLFDFWKFPKERPLPPQTCIVPVLYQGAVDLNKVSEVMADLKNTGSKLSPGFMRPEGVVVMAFGTRYKKVFEAEETRWTGGDQNAKAEKDTKIADAMSQYGHLLQPIRLQKLLSKEEKYVSEFPSNMNSIVDAYMTDLISENQVSSDVAVIVRKTLGSQIFKFVREVIENA